MTTLVWQPSGIWVVRFARGRSGTDRGAGATARGGPSGGSSAGSDPSGPKHVPIEIDDPEVFKLRALEQAAIDDVLGALAKEINYGIIGEPDTLAVLERAERRIFGLYMPQDVRSCLAVQPFADAEAAARALARPYRSGIAPPPPPGHVGLVLDAEQRQVTPVVVNPAESSAFWDKMVLSGIASVNEAIATEDGEDSGYRLESGVEVLDVAGLPVRLHRHRVEKLRRALARFEVIDQPLTLHPGRRPLAGPPPIPLPGAFCAVYGEPGAVRRLEIYSDMGEALLCMMEPDAEGMLPQYPEETYDAGYLIDLDSGRIEPVGHSAPAGL